MNMTLFGCRVHILLQHKSKGVTNSKGAVPPFDETDAKIAAMLTDGGLIKAGSSKTILVKGTECETRYYVMMSKRLYYREPFSILPVLAEHDWRLSVLESDNSIIPQNPPKIEASDWCHKGVVIVYICLLWGQPIRRLHFGGKLEKRNYCHPLPHQTSNHFIFF